jgi:GAF domain-containing protein/HAMP domain-containing protein
MNCRNGQGKTMFAKIKRLVTGTLRNKLILTNLLVAFIVLAIMGIYAIWSASVTLTEQVRHEQEVELAATGQQLAAFLIGLEQDVFFLSQSPNVQELLSIVGSNPQVVDNARQKVEQEFLAFAQARQIYDQIRFIDVSGNEVVRVNTNTDGVSRIVPPDELQNKSDRYYFTESIAVPPNQVYVSPLDLNVEQGQVEVLADGSYKPVIRYGTPVIHNGRTAGVIVTNVLATNLLDLLADSSSMMFLLDEDGYYLYHPDEARRWGRDLGTEARVTDDFDPEVVQQLFSGTTGTLNTSGDFISYSTVEIPDLADISWYLGQVQSQATVYQPLFNFLYGAILVILFAMVTAIVSAFYIDRIIAKPIEDLKDAAIQMTAGDFETKIKPTTEDEIGTLTVSFNTMADRLAEMVQDLEKRVSGRTRALEASAIISRQLTTILDSDQLMKQVVQLIQQTFLYYHVHIYLINNETNELIMREGSGVVGQQLKSQRHKLQMGQGIVGRVAAGGEPVLVEDVDEFPGFFRNPLLPDTRSELAVPLRKQDEVFGVLDMQSKTPGGFNLEDQVLMQSVADQVAVALEKARLFQELQQSAEIAGDLTRRLTHEGWSQIETYADSSGYVFSSGKIESATPNDWMPAMDGALVAQQMIQHHPDSFNGQPGNMSISIPLLLRDEVIGVIGLERSDNMPWSEDEVISLQTISDQITLALEAARLARETERAAWRDQMVSESTARVWSSAEIEEVMRTAVTQLGHRLQASEVVIRLGTEDEILGSNHDLPEK